ncbi:hypothetical protein [Pontibacter sp. SGAir0037]|uniref:hypothetical protein n=1 Tax=Pontibacter sp. SGAir0037 TaxID=2571030 RepID=UPI0010CCD808|nr:hypothetical protein [Pontibacter sp. SGAir0037]QCR24236.1 hypothetical protein C1N53_19000 [Pontibacter sp. SGAir0037]
MATKKNKSSQVASGKSSIAGTSGKGGLGNITGKLQEFGSSTVQKVGSLSTTQKVVGGSLLAVGAGWLAVNSMSPASKNKIKHQVSSQFDKIKGLASSSASKSNISKS